MKTYNVCWTGGVDSTFVVTQLSQFPVAIKPFYIKGQTFRLSEPQELEAITSMRKLLLEDPRTKAELLPLEIIEKNDLRIRDRQIINTHRRLYMRMLEGYKAMKGGKLPPAGSQDIYVEGANVPTQDIAFASLAKSLGEPIEIGLHQDDMNHIHAYKLFSRTIEYDHTTERNIMHISENVGDEDLYTLYKDIRLPIVGQNMNKLDVWQWFFKNGYQEILSKTITCQEPVLHSDGSWEPCGKCEACISEIRANVLEPFTAEGLARYRDYEENHIKEPERFRLKGF